MMIRDRQIERMRERGSRTRKRRTKECERKKRERERQKACPVESLYLCEKDTAAGT